MKKTPMMMELARTNRPPMRILGTQRGSSKANVNGLRKSNDAPGEGGEGGGSGTTADDIQRKCSKERNLEENEPVQASTEGPCQSSFSSSLRIVRGAAGYQPLCSSRSSFTRCS